MKALVCALALLATACNLQYGDGQRVGTVVKVSKKGFFCKTWEGVAFIGGGATGVMTPEAWEFSVESDEIAHTLEAAQASQRPVKLLYREVRLMTPCQPDSAYRVYRVEPL